MLAHSCIKILVLEVLQKTLPYAHMTLSYARKGHMEKHTPRYVQYIINCISLNVFFHTSQKLCLPMTHTYLQWTIHGEEWVPEAQGIARTRPGHTSLKCAETHGPNRYRIIIHASTQTNNIANAASATPHDQEQRQTRYIVIASKPSCSVPDCNF